MKRSVCLLALSMVIPVWCMNSDQKESDHARQYMLTHLQNIIEEHVKRENQPSPTSDSHIPYKLFVQELHALLSKRTLDVTEKTNVIVNRAIAHPACTDDLQQAALQLGCSVYITWQDLTKKIPQDEALEVKKTIHDRLASTILLASQVKESSPDDAGVKTLLNATILEAGQLHNFLCTHACTTISSSSMPTITAALPTCHTPAEEDVLVDDEQEYIPSSLSRAISRNMSACTFIFLLLSGISHVGMVAWDHVHQNQHPIMAPPHHGHSTHAELPNNVEAARMLPTPNPWHQY